MRRTWIEDRLQELGRKKKDLAQAMGLEPARVSEIIGNRRPVHTSELAPFARVLDMSPQEALDALTGRTHARSPAQTVVVRSYVQGGVYSYTHELPEDEQEEISLPSLDVPATRLHAHKVRGTSMDKVYPEGSIVICMTPEELPAGDEMQSGDHVVVQRRAADDGIESTVKELHQHSDGTWWLWPRSTDPNFQQPIYLPCDQDADQAQAPEIEITGLVVYDLRPRARHRFG